MKVLSIVLATMLVSPTASAQVLETNRTNSTNNCEGARPIDRDALRHRPLAVVNEYGASAAFVTCAYASKDSLIGVSAFGLRFTNSSSQPQTVDCTGVVGEEGSPLYYPKSITLAPSATGSLAWSGSDNQGLLFGDRLSVSCFVPPQVALNDNWITALLPVF